MVSHETLRRAIAKEQVDPDQYRKERGRCPRGYKFADVVESMRRAVAPVTPARG